MLAVVQRRACASTAEQMAMVWSAVAAVVSEREGEARSGESRSVTGECGHVVARWSPMWPGRAARRQRMAPHGGEALNAVGYCSVDSEFQSEPDSETSSC